MKYSRVAEGADQLPRTRRSAGAQSLAWEPGRGAGYYRGGPGTTGGEPGVAKGGRALEGGAETGGPSAPPVWSLGDLVLLATPGEDVPPRAAPLDAAAAAGGSPAKRKAAAAAAAAAQEDDWVDDQHEAEAAGHGQVLAAQAACLVLTHSPSARAAYARAGGLVALPALLASPHVEVRFAGAGCLHAFTREAEDRALIAPAQAATCLYALVDLCRWCLDQLRAPPQATKRSVSHAANHGRARGELLDQAAAALWGCAAALARARAWADVLAAGDSRWAAVARDVALCPDRRVGPLARESATGALAALAAGLAAQLVRDPAFLADALGTLENKSGLATTKTLEHTAYVLAQMMAVGQGRETQEALAKGTLGRVLALMSRGRAAAAAAAAEEGGAGGAGGEEGAPEAGAPTAEAEDRQSEQGLTPLLEKNLACAMMYLCSEIYQPWATGELEAVVACLGSRQKWTLAYAAMAVWCLARDPLNRQRLGDLWAVEGVLGVLRANSDLQLKEYCLAALWLLACDDRNAVRVSMKGGLQLAAGMLKFGNGDEYLALKTLCCGLLFHLWDRPALRPLLGCLKLTKPLLEAVRAPQGNSFLKILASGLVFCLCEDKEIRADFEAEGGPNVLEDIFAAMICSQSPELQTVGVFGAAALALVPKSKRALGRNGGAEGLVRLLRRREEEGGGAAAGGPHGDLREKVLHALLNISTDPFSQNIICKKALKALVAQTRRAAAAPRAAEFAAGVLSNMLANPACRRVMYREQLRAQSRRVGGAAAAAAAQVVEEALGGFEGGPEEEEGGGGGGGGGYGDGAGEGEGESRGPADDRGGGGGGGGGGRRRAGPAAAAPSARARFEGWVSDLKAGDPGRPATALERLARPSGGGGGGGGGGGSTADVWSAAGGMADTGALARPRTTLGGLPTLSASMPALPGAGAAAAGGPERDRAALARARRKLRLPVSAIWDRDAELYATNRAHVEALLLKTGDAGALARGDEASSPRGPFGAALAAARRRRGRQQQGGGGGSGRVAAPRTPLPGSHRIGPAGPLGSVDHPVGEDRWRPYVLRVDPVVEAPDGTTRLADEYAALALEGRPGTGGGGGGARREEEEEALMAAGEQRAPRRRRQQQRGAAAAPAPAASTPKGRPELQRAMSRLGSPTTPKNRVGIPDGSRTLGTEGNRPEESISNKNVLLTKKRRQRLAPVQVELDPKGFYNTFTFHRERPRAVDLDRYQPATLAKFEHVEGCATCSDLYDHFVAEDGTTFHFYHSSTIRCEALDPGPYPRPAPPVALEQVLQGALPPVPPPTEPQGPAGRPQLYVPAPALAPRVRAHAVDLCREACAQANHAPDGTHRCPGVNCTMFGVIPVRPLRLYSKQTEEVIEDEPEEEKLEEAAWVIQESIFGPRAKEAEARDYTDTDKQLNRALKVDWDRMLKEERVWTLVQKKHRRVREEGQEAAEALAELKALFQARYRAVISAFDYYCVVSNLTGSAGFSIQQNQYMSFVQDCDIPDKNCSVEAISQIFVAVNFESDKGSMEADVNEDRALMRFEFVECMIRIAAKKYENQTEYLNEAVERLMNEHLLAKLPPEALHDRDDWRRRRLYNRECDSALGRHSSVLSLLYRRYSMLKPLSGKAVFGLDEWAQLLDDSGVLGGSVLSCTLRDARLAFFFARTLVADEVKRRFQIQTLTKLEFYEALGRLADCMSIPTQANLDQINALNIIEYCFQFKKAPPEIQRDLLARRHSAGMLRYQEGKSYTHNPSRPLAQKLEVLVKYIIAAIGLHTKGILKVEKKQINLVSAEYLTTEQVQRGPLVQ